MPVRIITIVDCPFCNGGVFLNAPAYLAEVEPGEEEYIYLPQDAEQRAIGFDRRQHSPVACPHLYVIDGSCAPVEAGYLPDRLLDFCYEHPAREPFIEKTEIRFGLDPASLPQSDDPVKFATRFAFDAIDKIWFHHTAEGKLEEFRVWGEALFVEDVARLHKELPEY